MAVVEADTWRREQQMQLAVTGAWYGANYQATVRSGKRLPPLKGELRKLRGKPLSRGKRQSAEEQIAILKMHGASLAAKKR